MIPETITFSTTALIRFFLTACPAFFLGIMAGASIVMYQVNRTGYHLVWKQVGHKRWPVMEKRVPNE